jgi:hypothetical protein
MHNKNNNYNKNNTNNNSNNNNYRPNYNKSIKDVLVDYTSNKIRKREVCIQDILETLNIEFPEFLQQITHAYYQAGFEDAMKQSKSVEPEVVKHTKKKHHNKRHNYEDELY